MPVDPVGLVAEQRRELPAHLERRAARPAEPGPGGVLERLGPSAVLEGGRLDPGRGGGASHRIGDAVLIDVVDLEEVPLVDVERALDPAPIERSAALQERRDLAEPRRHDGE